MYKGDSGRCNRECFANYDGLCRALKEVPTGKCPFRRTDITMEQQYADMALYNPLAKVENE